MLLIWMNGGFTMWNGMWMLHAKRQNVNVLFVGMDITTTFAVIVVAMTAAMPPPPPPQTTPTAAAAAGVLHHHHHHKRYQRRSFRRMTSSRSYIDGNSTRIRIVPTLRIGHSKVVGTVLMCMQSSKYSCRSSRVGSPYGLVGTNPVHRGVTHGTHQIPTTLHWHVPKRTCHVTSCRSTIVRYRRQRTLLGWTMGRRSSIRNYPPTLLDIKIIFRTKAVRYT
mmetsp:Transcript_18387/g.44421  ORF Transcript_18387/g.44421 Transcript_18387/m.44421 type:complete len:221 (+) Transcript_18387:733-1395(+)